MNSNQDVGCEQHDSNMSVKNCVETLSVINFVSSIAIDLHHRNIIRIKWWIHYCKFMCTRKAISLTWYHLRQVLEQYYLILCCNFKRYMSLRKLGFIHETMCFSPRMKNTTFDEVLLETLIRHLADFYKTPCGLNLNFHIRLEDILSHFHITCIYVCILERSIERFNPFTQPACK